jgi:hypothetical protein
MRRPIWFYLITSKDRNGWRSSKRGAPADWFSRPKIAKTGPINAILDPGANLIHGSARSMMIERTPGYGIKVLDAYLALPVCGILMLVICINKLRKLYLKSRLTP